MLQESCYPRTCYTRSKMNEESGVGVLKWVQARVPIEYMLLAILIYLSIEPSPSSRDAPQSSNAASYDHGPQALVLQCDVRAGNHGVGLLTWVPALCPALQAAAVTTSRKLAGSDLDLPEHVLTWYEASELLQYLPFVLFRFPDHKGAGLLAILASHFTDGPKAPVPRESLGIPNNNDTNPTTASSNLTVRNRFARSFSQLVASQLVPGDLITMAKSQGILTNMGVDYVVVFRFATTGEYILA
jgi:hypothetical protein